MSSHGARCLKLTSAVLVLINLVLVNTVDATEPFTPSPEEGECGYCGVMEIDRLTALLADEVLRDLICRLSYERYTPASLSAALNLPEGQVLHRIKTLRGWGLVRMVRQDSATTVVEAIPGSGTQTLHRWASQYCPHGDGCGRLVEPSLAQATTVVQIPAGAKNIASIGGGRLSGKIVTVFGGSGLLGRELIKQLAQTGAKIRVVARKPESVQLLKMFGKPGQIELMAVNIGYKGEIKGEIPRTRDMDKFYYLETTRGLRRRSGARTWW